ncbi:FRG domain-containing protein [Pseudoalteromonas sp. 20-92]|uniref:FRG domain-containing protein n=1 Tax=Pseudoalteromonas sp. 20-92 TaxID=2969394 RepID=UPI0027B46266|nr:FRG domain-containing protein [Pseudoalteromonas sp. 20-92]MDQ2042611.1 FRG domain-containing protein [Pseudoalteromonas sp. 20-92]
MGRKPRWVRKNISSTIVEFQLTSWKYFSDFINQELLNATNYFFRGHGDSKWKLEPTLDRIIKEPESIKRELLLNKFKFETRGRRGKNPSKLISENDWWALGQHHGLATPLLDWTESPFVALYFAAHTALNSTSDAFAVYALASSAIEKRSKVIKNDESIDFINKRKPTTKIIRPFSDENERLVSQRGLFTRSPNNMDIERWIKTYETKDSGNFIELAKFIIPNKNIHDCLKYLNRMNINHSTLFPDLSGASQYCNMHLNIQTY